MNGQQPRNKPGDLILDRYMPNATQDEREQARDRLRRLARLIARVHKRLADEDEIRRKSEGRIE